MLPFLSGAAVPKGSIFSDKAKNHAVQNEFWGRGGTALGEGIWLVVKGFRVLSAMKYCPMDVLHPMRAYVRKGSDHE
jgi:hypothetical protein